MTPTDWREEEIRSFASIGTGAKDTKDRSSSGRFPFFVRSQKVERIDSWSFDGEAVLTAGDGVGTGKVFHYINGKFDCHQRVYRIGNFRADVSGRYFYYQFSSNFLARIESLTAKSSVDSVRMEAIAGMRIMLPGRKEQDLIVQAIDDVDELITSLERFIAKKEAIKKGMMQQLLTEETRLPGFSSAWRTGTIGELCTMRSGSPKKRAPGGKYWVVDMGSVTREADLVVTRKTNETAGILHRGELVMPKDDIGGGNIIGRTGLIDRSDTYVLADHVYALTPRSVNAAFLNYAINGHRVNASLRSQATGSAQLGLSKRSVLDQEVSYPSEIEEQLAIAAVLTDVATEVSALRRRLVKARDVKTGMMQQLLTGRTRLAGSAS